MIPPDHVDALERRWTLQRGWPRPDGQVHVDLADHLGNRVAGRWFPDAQEAARAASRMPELVLDASGQMVIHPEGADPGLPGVADAVAGGAVLVAHRPGRRVVVRTPTGAFRKFVRPRRVASLVAAQRHLRSAVAGLAEVPEVVDAGEDWMELAALHGTPPLDLAAAQDHEAWTTAWWRCGRLLGHLARAADTGGLEEHTAIHEADVARTAVARAVAAGRLPDVDVEDALADLLVGADPCTAVCHRDMHDGQLLVTRTSLGLLDADTLAAGEPALDLANLLVHLDLRVAQGLLDEERRASAERALLRGAEPLPATLSRLDAHARACRLRLAGVYAFRPRYRDLACRWLHLASTGDDRSRTEIEQVG